MKKYLFLSLGVLLVFSGCGKKEEMKINESVTVISQEAISENIANDARLTLTTFFDQLSKKRYSEATKYFGGDYMMLKLWHPSVAPTETTRLWREECETTRKNSIMKCLPIKEVVSEEKISDDEYKFRVSFANTDGTIFVLDGLDPEEPDVQEFDYTVKKIDGAFRVMDLPQYWVE